MPKDKKIKQRAQALKEAEELAKAEALKKQQQEPKQEPQTPQPPTTEQSDEDIPLAETIEPEPTTEHRQPLIKYHAIQDSPGKNAEGKPVNNKGAKGLYTDEICLVVEELASKGLTNDQIAASIGIGRKTFYEWIHRYPHFSHALNKYRGLANMYVENALFRSALGYDYTEEQAVRTEFGSDVVEVRKHLTGSVAAQKYYLNNRMPDRYKNKIEQTLNLPPDIQGVAIVIKRRED